VLVFDSVFNTGWVWQGMGRGAFNRAPGIGQAIMKHTHRFHCGTSSLCFTFSLCIARYLKCFVSVPPPRVPEAH